MITAKQANALLAEKTKENDEKVELMAKEVMDMISERLEHAIASRRNIFNVEVDAKYGECIGRVDEAMKSLGYQFDCSHEKRPDAPWLLTVRF